MQLALNHMTTPRLDWRALLMLAKRTGCAGVEFRNDLGRPLFEGFTAETVCEEAQALGLRIFGLSQVGMFNDWSDAKAQEVASLITIAQDLEAETISLIPRSDGTGLDDLDAVKTALREILPLLEEADMTALVEPLGFVQSSLRTKAEAIEAIEAVGGAGRFRLVHDTFHHFLSGETEIFADWTGMVHVSGVTDPDISLVTIADRDRGVVTEDDRMDNLGQLSALKAAGYTGPVSMEAFAPEFHNLPADKAEGLLMASFDLLRTVTG